MRVLLFFKARDKTRDTFNAQCFNWSIDSSIKIANKHPSEIETCTVPERFIKGGSTLILF